MPLQPGTRLGNYEVLTELGRGGMGEVYKARDLKLGREVAIKVLPQEMASDSQRLRRFEQEARAASALNHPNIVTIYEIGEHEGTPYIAMEYVDGVTLREMLAGGPLSNDKLIRYATQMAEGLAKAHQAGIVHRDLKPENMIVSDDGFVKILDFGLAKLSAESAVGAEDSTLARQTSPGSILGTVGYMSPEQAKGEPTDFRSDQFALGAILYEMATGTRAFARDSSAQSLAAIIEVDPEPITSINPSVPGHLASVVDRCLAKSARERYDSTWDIAKQVHREGLDLPRESPDSRSLATFGVGGLLAIILIMFVGLFFSDVQEWIARPPSTIESIAVLPLHNASGDPEQEYLADGMTDALIHELAQIAELRVVSRTSVMQYKSSQKTLPQIGRELEVDVVLEGAVLRSHNRIGLTTQLVDAASDSQLWSGSYERSLEDVLVLRKEVARAIVAEVRVVLTPEEQAALASAATVDAEAYDAYQRGRFTLEKFTEVGVREAIEYAEESLLHDPDFAPAHALLAAAYSTLTYVSRAAPADLSTAAKNAAIKALSLDENLADAHAVLAWIRLSSDWDWSGAEASYLRALELQPGLSGGVGSYSHFLAAVGRFDESIRLARRAKASEPVNPNEAENLAFVLYMARRFDESIAESRRGLELHPNHPYLRTRLARALAERGQLAEAIEAAEQADRLAGGDPDRRAMLGRLYAIAGREDEARAILQELERDAAQGYVPPTALARIYLGLNDYERALELLEQAYVVRDGDMYLLKTWPVWDPLRDDPRFQDLLRRMNFPER